MSFDSGFWAALSEKFKKIKHENAYLNDEKHPIFKNFDEAKLSTMPGFELHMLRCAGLYLL